MTNIISPAFAENNIAILFSANNYFIPYASVMVQSIIDQSSSENNYDIVFFHSGLTEYNKSTLSGMTKGKSNFSIRFVDVSKSSDQYELFTDIKGGRLTREAYYRLLAVTYYSEEYDKLIYLDGDMVTLTDVAELYDIDISDYLLAAPYDISSISKCRKFPEGTIARYRKNELNLTNPDDYFISGLIVFNLVKLRKQFPGHSLMDLAESRDWRQHDQDVLNVICNDGGALMLHPEWNVLYDFHPSVYLPDGIKEKWLESKKHPKVIHYGGRKKPWEQNVPRQSYFWRTAARSPFFNEIVKLIVEKGNKYSEEEKLLLEDDIAILRDKMLSAPETSCLFSYSNVLGELAKRDSERRYGKKTDDPLISVIMPVYNAAEFLERSVGSILGQTYQNLEIILVDDGSTDGSSEMCDEFRRRDNRVKVIHKSNGGVASARNAGLKEAKGEYIGWVDVDDFIQCDMYEYLVYNAAKYGAPVTVCGYVNVKDNKHFARFRNEDSVLMTSEALEKLFEYRIRNYQYDKLWDRALYNGETFLEGTVYEDTRLTYRLFEKARWITLLKEPKYFRVWHDGSIVSNPSPEYKIMAVFSVIDRFDDIKDRWPELRTANLRNAISVFGKLAKSVANSNIFQYLKYRKELRKISAFTKDNINYFLGPKDVTDNEKKVIEYLSEGTYKSFKKASVAFAKTKKDDEKELNKKRELDAKITKKARQRLEERCSKEELAALNKEPEGEGPEETIEEATNRFFRDYADTAEEVKILQEGNLYLLKKFRDICEENNIQYFMLGGTLLGAVRHKGYIPWDDDLDIGMERGEFERFCEAVTNYPEVRVKRYYHTPGSWQTYKVVLDDERSPFWLDLLLYDYAGDDNKTKDELWNEITEIREKARCYLRKKRKGQSIKYIDSIVYDDRDAREIDRIFSKHRYALPPVLQRQYIYRSIDNACGSWQQLFPVERMMPFCELEFEGDMYYAPKDYEWYLQLQYGDCNRVPDDIGHVHNRFIADKLEDVEHIQQLLNEMRSW